VKNIKKATLQRFKKDFIGPNSWRKDL